MERRACVGQSGAARQLGESNYTPPPLPGWAEPGCAVSIRRANGDITQTGLFKQQIDWIPLSSGSVRPTQGRTLAVAQVCGGSQSFNAVNSLRILGRWMRMFTIPNQSSVPRAYTQFTPDSEGSRMMASSNRDRLVDCMEELVKYTIVMRPHFNLFGDRFSERQERRAKQEEEDRKMVTELGSTVEGRP